MGKAIAWGAGAGELHLSGGFARVTPVGFAVFVVHMDAFAKTSRRADEVLLISRL